MTQSHLLSFISGLLLVWLVVWNIFFIFPNSWDDDPIEGLKPPTSSGLLVVNKPLNLRTGG
jgi:hypothetical protein